MNPAHAPVDPIDETAARWLQLRAERALFAHEADELALWLARSERHARAYERLSRAWTSPAVWTALAALAEEERRPAPRLRMGGLALAGMGLAAAVAFAFVWFQPVAPVDAVYATATAQVQSVDLADGSRLHLNGETQAVARFDRRSRRIELIAGELSIEVAHENRPLQVIADGAVITAVGTAFNVDRRADGLALFVSDGSVEVSGGAWAPVRVTAGQSARVSATSVAVAAADPLAAAWREGALATSGVSIGALAHALSRFTDREIVIAPGIANEVVSGRFSLTQPDRTLRLLAAAYDWELREEPTRFVLSTQVP